MHIFVWYVYMVFVVDLKHLLWAISFILASSTPSIWGYIIPREQIAVSFIPVLLPSITLQGWCAAVLQRLLDQVKHTLFWQFVSVMLAVLLTNLSTRSTKETHEIYDVWSKSKIAKLRLYSLQYAWKKSVMSPTGAHHVFLSKCQFMFILFIPQEVVRFVKEYLRSSTRNCGEI